MRSALPETLEPQLATLDALQNAFDGKATEQIQLFVFDVPYLNGDDLRSRSLSDRRRILKSVLSTSR